MSRNLGLVDATIPSWAARSANLSGDDLAATSRKIASRLSVSNCASCFNCPSKNASLANAVLIANKYKTIFAYCAFLAGLSVLLGAFGAHTLSKYISPYKLDVFNKASSYLMSHSLAVVLLLLLKNTTNLRPPRVPVKSLESR